MSEHELSGYLRHVLELAALPPLPAPKPDGLSGWSAVVINGTTDQRRTVAAGLARHGAAVAEADALPDTVDLVVDLGIDVFAPASAWRAAFTRTIELLKAVHQDWAAESRADRLHYVAVTQMGGEMGLGRVETATQALGGLWAGLAKTLPREFPVCQPHVVDVAAAADPVAAVVAEVTSGTTFEVGHGEAGRLTLLPRPRAADGPPIALGSEDVVLFTGGARGIGFEIALELATRYGCQVVVTGRAPLLDPPPAWLSQPAAAQAEDERRMYQTRGATSVPEVRRAIAGQRQLREVWANLERARAVGAPLTYQPCDVTQRAEVLELVTTLRPGLSMVVHNAGIDRPASLARKTPAECVAVAAVKVDGFRHLITALHGHRLKMLCAVGSQTGRYGGMPGQVDYAAGNDGLARLGQWAGQHLPYPVKTLAWPTWDGVGLITNLAAASRYMKPISLPAGVAAWRAELTTAGRGEIGFMGEIGEVAPRYLYGLPVPSDWRGAPAVLSRRFLLGGLRTFTPGTAMETVHHFDITTDACLADTLVDGKPGLPVALALELMFAVRLWLAPMRPDRVWSWSAEDIQVSPGRMTVGVDDAIVLTRTAAARWSGDELLVAVQLRHGEALAAQAVLRFADSADFAPDPVGVATAAPTLGDGQYRWRPLSFAPPRWQPGAADDWWTTGVDDSPADWFPTGRHPAPTLPLDLVETVANLTATSDPTGDTWAAESAWFAEGCTSSAVRLIVARSSTSACFVDHADAVVGRLVNPRWRSAAEPHMSNRGSQ